MADDGLCQYCGAYIGTESWASCPNCGEEFDDGDYDEDDDEGSDDE